MTKLVQRTGPSVMGVIQGHTYTVTHRRPSDGRLRLEEEGGEGWPIWFHESGFKPVSGQVREIKG